MRLKVWPALVRFWAIEHGLSIFLVLLVVVILVLPALRPVGTLGRIVGDAIFSLLLISGAAAIPRRRLTLLIVSVVATAALLVRWASMLAPSVVLEEWRALSSLVSVGLLSLIVLAQVFRKGPVTLSRIQGAIAVYLLLGLAWAIAYELLALRQPGAFAGAGVDGDLPQRWLYYSFVTLTTVGYGDVTPVHPIARSLAVLEALTGQLYPAILLARLVSLEVQPRGTA
jgi:Ion channel